MVKHMKKILLISFFNSSNIGDQAICEVIYRNLSKRCNVTKMDISGKEIRCNRQSGNDSNISDNSQKCRFYCQQ